MRRAVNDNVAVRAEVEALSDYIGTGVGGFGGVLAAPIYFKKTYDGFLLEPGVRYQSLSKSGTSVSYYGPQVLAGWQWMWDSGLNFSAAFGMGRIWSSSNDSSAELKGVLPAGFMRVGYAFE